MYFNYFKEIKKFNDDHIKMRNEYRMAGMSDEDIDEVFAMDWEFFKQERVEAYHRAEFEPGELEGEELKATKSAWDKLYEQACADYYTVDHCLNSHIDWTDPEDMDRLRRFITKLTQNQRMILEKYVFDHKGYEEIAKDLNVTRSAISRQMVCIRKKFEKYF